MKRLFAILFLVNLTWAYPLISFNGEWYGTTGHFGPYSVFHSPQNLAGKYNPSFVLMLPYLHTGFNNNLISLDFYNRLAPMDTITDEFKQDILEKIGESFEVSQYSSVMPFGLSIGPIGIASRVVEGAKVNVPKDLFRIALYGVQVNNSYDFSNLSAEAISYVQNTLGFGIKERIGNKKVYFGLSGSYILGLGYAKITSRTGRVEVSDTTIVVKDTVDFMYSVPAFVFRLDDFEPKDLTSFAGYGYSVTFGTAVELTPRFTLGLTAENLLSNIRWSSDSSFTGIAAINSTEFNLYDLYSADSIKEIFTDTLERNAGSFNTKLPLILRLSGRYDFYRAPFRFYFDLEQGFRNTALSSTKPRLSLAMELNTFLPILLGATFGGGQRPSFSLGTGFQLPFMFINAGISNQGGFVSSAEGLSATVTAGLRIPIVQRLKGTIVDSTTGTPLIAKVTVEGEDGKVKSVTAKEDGTFNVKVPWGWTKVSIHAENYTSKDTVFFIDKKEEVKATFYLKPLVGELVVTVTDFVTGLPKAYVQVIVFDETGRADTLLTDSLGKVSKKYLEGVYSIKVEEANYKPIYETFDIKPLEVTTKNFTIVPVEGEIIGRVIDAKTLSPLLATVEIYDSTGNLIETMNTSEKGEFSLRLKEGLYKVKAQAEKYIPYETNFVIEGGKKTTKDIALLKKKMVFTFRNIYFEFNKADIKPESYPVLDSIALFLKEYPNVKVEIGGHTDSRGSDAYNLKLSQARANAVREYLIKVHNISPDRLIAKGYGERRLVVYPEKTEEDYQMNRRVEFTILGTIE